MGIEQHLDLSTSHITPHTLVHLKDCPHKIVDYEFGSFFWVSPDGDVHQDTPDDLKLVLKYAAINGCIVVRFDADAPIIEALPQYEWLEAIAL